MYESVRKEPPKLPNMLLVFGVGSIICKVFQNFE
jgi:hypothetical protein